MPAKKASGRLSSNANHTGGREPSGKTSFSAKLVKGTMQRLSTPSHRRQRDDLTLRMLVTPGSVFLPAMANAGDGMPQRAMEFAHAILRGTDDRRGIIGEDAGQHRQVAVRSRMAPARSRIACWPFAVEIAHGAQPLIAARATQGITRALRGHCAKPVASLASASGTRSCPAGYTPRPRRVLGSRHLAVAKAKSGTVSGRLMTGC